MCIFEAISKKSQYDGELRTMCVELWPNSVGHVGSAP